MVQPQEKKPEMDVLAGGPCERGLSAHVELESSYDKCDMDMGAEVVYTPPSRSREQQLTVVALKLKKAGLVHRSIASYQKK